MYVVFSLILFDNFHDTCLPRNVSDTVERQYILMQEQTKNDPNKTEADALWLFN